jgi:hypothetical protein
VSLKFRRNATINTTCRGKRMKMHGQKKRQGEHLPAAAELWAWGTQRPACIEAEHNTASFGFARRRRPDCRCRGKDGWIGNELASCCLLVGKRISLLLPLCLLAIFA